MEYIKNKKNKQFVKSSQYQLFLKAHPFFDDKKILELFSKKNWPNFSLKGGETSNKLGLTLRRVGTEKYGNQSLTGLVNLFRERREREKGKWEIVLLHIETYQYLRVRKIFSATLKSEVDFYDSPLLYVRILMMGTIIGKMSYKDQDGKMRCYKD